MISTDNAKKNNLDSEIEKGKIQNNLKESSNKISEEKEKKTSKHEDKGKSNQKRLEKKEKEPMKEKKEKEPVKEKKEKEPVSEEESNKKKQFSKKRKLEEKKVTDVDVSTSEEEEEKKSKQKSRKKQKSSENVLSMEDDKTERICGTEILISKKEKLELLNYYDNKIKDIVLKYEKIFVIINGEKKKIKPLLGGIYRDMLEIRSYIELSQKY